MELTRVGFTGADHDRDLGLIDMNGRIYDPLAGRFTSPDPIMSAPFQSQGLNRYGYVLNDPVNLTDPSGFAVAQICGLLGECYPNEAPSGAFGDLSSPADIADDAIGSGGLADAAAGLGANAVDIAIRAVLGDPFAAKPGHTVDGTSSVRRAQASVKPGAGQGGADLALTPVEEGARKFETPMPRGAGASPSLAKEPGGAGPTVDKAMDDIRHGHIMVAPALGELYVGLQSAWRWLFPAARRRRLLMRRSKQP